MLFTLTKQTLLVKCFYFRALDGLAFAVESARGSYAAWRRRRGSPTGGSPLTARAARASRFRLVVPSARMPAAPALDKALARV